MDDYIIDTNVLLVASAHHPGSPFADSDVPVEQRKVVLEWLMAFRADRQRKMVLDQFFEIWEEYNHKMTGQDIGLLVVMEKLQFSSVRFVDIAYDANGHGCLPSELEKVVHDLADRKVVAVALIDVSQDGKSTIVNAVDSDWRMWEKDLERFGITVKHLIDNKDRERKPKRTRR